MKRHSARDVRPVSEDGATAAISRDDICCQLCGSRDVQFLFAETNAASEFRAYHCARCDLHQTLGSVPPISPDYIDLQESELVGEHVFLQRAHKLPAFRQWLRLAQKARPSQSRGQQTLLDVGCGIGGFLDFAAGEGFDTFGFDASAAQVAQAQRAHPRARLALTIEDYMAMIGSPPRFDHITLWDVFEHIRTPSALLRGARDALADDGLLYVSVPSGALNRLKLALRRALKRETGLIPWEHVFYYTPRSLRLVMEQAGFEVLAIGAVEPYVRSLSIHELARRAAHRLLGLTPLALQIYALCRVRRV